MTSSLASLRTLYKQQEEEALGEFFSFLRYESISSEAEKKDKVRACADWLQSKIEELGFETELWETSGHPLLFASCLAAGPNAPTLLIYNHYDVQPVDPLELWDTPPFEPSVKDGQVYARGAQDNKGQCFYVLQALKLLMQRDGSLPVNIKLCIEGEEETGSSGLSEILEQKAEQLRSDYLVIADVGIRKPDAPAITLGVRGIVTMDVSVSGSKTDLHSGAHGGLVYNPIHALIEILNALRDEKGAVAVPGFYDDVLPMSKKEKEQLSLDFDPDEYRDMFGAEPCGGENDYTPLERAWTRPTLEINGISGGYAGTGFKTVIPAEAHAKISCRMVPDQDPVKIGKIVADFIKAKAPKGISVTTDVHSGVGAAVRADLSSPVVKAFSEAYREVFEKPVEYIFEGGSIPIVTELSRASGASVVLVGLGLPDDLIHAPNEHFGIDRLEKGALIVARAIENLSGNAQKQNQ